MKTIRKQMSFSNIVACAALFLALSGTAYAAAKNSIGSAQLKKNAVTSAKIKSKAVTNAKIKNSAITSSKIKNSAVTNSKIKNGAVTSSKIQNNAVTGDKVNTATLGKVPSAAQADLASGLSGQSSVFLRMSFGQTATVAQNGSVSIEAKCVGNEGGNEGITLLGKTTQDGAILSGEDDLYGGDDPNNFLNVATDEDNRDFEYYFDTAGETSVGSQIDSGFVLGPDGKMITTNSEGIALGLNYLGADCIVAGVFNHLSQ